MAPALGMRENGKVSMHSMQCNARAGSWKQNIRSMINVKLYPTVNI